MVCAHVTCYNELLASAGGCPSNERKACAEPSLSSQFIAYVYKHGVTEFQLEFQLCLCLMVSSRTREVFNCTTGADARIRTLIISLESGLHATYKNIYASRVPSYSFGYI